MVNNSIFYSMSSFLPTFCGVAPFFENQISLPKVFNAPCIAVVAGVALDGVSVVPSEDEASVGYLKQKYFTSWHQSLAGLALPLQKLPNDNGHRTLLRLHTGLGMALGCPDLYLGPGLQLKQLPL